MIDELVERIRNTQLSDKDPGAEQRLEQGLAGYPDAIYVLAQTVLVQKYGLEQAQQQLEQGQQQMQSMQQQIDALQQQAQSAQQPHKSGSFLGNLLGLNEQPAAAPSYQQPPPYGGYAQPGYSQPAYAQPMPYGAPAGGGFLQSALRTAAGVAAGEMMFQGMESLFHGFGGGGGYGESRPGEVINNNYYGDDSPREHRAEGSNDSSFYNPSDDASRNDDTSNNSNQFADDSGYADNSSPDGDGGSFDDSSSGDDSSF